MPLDIIFVFILSSLLVVAFISAIGGGKISLKLVIAWIKAELTVDQNSRSSRRSGGPKLRPESKNKLITCRYCNQRVKAYRIQDHNKKCPKRPRSRNNRQNTRKSPTRRNTPFD